MIVISFNHLNIWAVMDWQHIRGVSPPSAVCSLGLPRDLC